VCSASRLAGLASADETSPPVVAPSPLKRALASIPAGRSARSAQPARRAARCPAPAQQSARQAGDAVDPCARRPTCAEPTGTLPPHQRQLKPWLPGRKPDARVESQNACFVRHGGDPAARAAGCREPTRSPKRTTYRWFLLCSIRTTPGRRRRGRPRSTAGSAQLTVHTVRGCLRDPFDYRLQS
jgi:hypothetical protein